MMDAVKNRAQPKPSWLMKLFGRLSRSGAKTAFRLRNHATITDIPTERFNAIVKKFKSEGWKQTYEYPGFDAWIDYGAIRLRKKGVTLFFEWDNWSEGSVEGPREFIEDFAGKNSVKVSYQWRWSEYDNNF
jgi:hypothetical protein